MMTFCSTGRRQAAAVRVGRIGAPALMCAAALFAWTLGLQSADAAASLDRPNFVVFLTDDQGWGDASCYGHPHIKTPALDTFAKQGVRLTNCYAACSVCSPSRSAILTGRTPYRNGVWRWIPSGSQYHLRQSEITIATLLKKRGYTTCHVGKWHLNGKFNSTEQPQPDDHGYDWWMATQNNASPSHKNPTNFVRNRKPVGKLEGFSAPLIADEAIDWLKNHRDKSKPFFLTVWAHEPHLPIESDPKFMSLYADQSDEGIRQHHGNITQLDHAFGKVLKTLDEMGVTDNTFVMFTSDNGPEGGGTKGRTRGSTGGLRGRKRSTYEGGIRVPGVVRWPAYFKKVGCEPGTESDEPVIGSDIFTTICAIVGVPLPNDRTIDGANMLPLFEGKPIVRDQPLYWRNHLSPKSANVAVRVGDWKIIGSDDLSRFELYNIKKDPRETTELSAKHSDRFEAMKKTLIAQDKAVLAEGPDWWKNDKPRRKRGKVKGKKLGAGVDKTGDFAVVKGATVTKSDLGYAVQSTGEGVALKKLDPPARKRVTFRLRYQSLATDRTRNACLAFGPDDAHDNLVKAGSMIGMGSHGVFEGAWENVQAGVTKAANFEISQAFDVVVTIDLTKKQVTAVIDGTTVKADLPQGLDRVAYYGYYVKGTSSAFSPIEVRQAE